MKKIDQHQYFVIQYNPEWTDSLGYMYGAVEWAQQHPDPHFCYQGYRFNASGFIEMFQILKEQNPVEPDADNIPKYSTNVLVTLKRWHGGPIKMSPGTICVFSEGEDSPSRIYRQFAVEDNKVWRISQERKTCQYDNVGATPTHLDQLIRSVTSLLSRAWQRTLPTIEMPFSLHAALGYYTHPKDATIFDPRYNTIKITQAYQEIEKFCENGVEGMPWKMRFMELVRDLSYLIVEEDDFGSFWTPFSTSIEQ